MQKLSQSCWNIILTLLRLSNVRDIMHKVWSLALLCVETINNTHRRGVGGWVRKEEQENVQGQDNARM